jgi:hypothetical protein
VVSDNIFKGISTSGSAMSPADIAAARTLARVVGSAIRAVASPDDQLSAFGSSLLGDLLNDMKTDPAAGPNPSAGTGTGAGPGGSQDTDPPFRVDWDLGPGSSGLRLTPDNVAQFQADLQSGIERASAQPDLDPAAYAQQRFAQLIAEGPSYTDIFAGDHDDDFTLVAGPGGAKPSPTAPTAGNGLQLNINNRAYNAFELLGSAPASDAFGLIPEAYRDIKFLAPLMQEQRLRSEVQRMRTLLGQSGLDVTPEKLGVRNAIDANGRGGYDMVDMVDRYANAVRLLDLSRQGVIELDTKTFTVLSVGTAKITPDVLINNIEQRYQAAFKDGFERAQMRLDAGESLRYPVDMPRQLQLGLAADDFAKTRIKDYLRAIGVAEGPGQLVALNRWAYDGRGSGFYVRPDVLIDFGPSYRHWIDGKSSYINSGVAPQQLQDFFRFTGSQTGTVATPVGSISVKAPNTFKKGP